MWFSNGGDAVSGPRNRDGWDFRDFSLTGEVGGGGNGTPTFGQPVIELGSTLIRYLTRCALTVVMAQSSDLEERINSAFTDSALH